MSLQTLSNFPYPILKLDAQDLNIQSRYFATRTSNLDNKDIEGSSPRLPGYRYMNKETFNLRNDDIERSSSRRLIPEQAKSVDNQLKNDDIPFTRPHFVKLYTKRAPSNPLEPVYQLASFE